MRGAWWKLLTILLLLYTFVAGNLIPLRSGIVSNKTDLAVWLDSTHTVQVNTYNTDFTADDPQQIKARLRLSQTLAFCAQSVAIQNSRQLAITFHLSKTGIDPIQLSSPFPLLEIGSPQNGYFFSAVPVRLAAAPAAMDSIPTQPCSVEQYPERKNMSYPFLNILEETIRNLFFHVPMWFGMMLLMLVSVVYSIRFLRHPDQPQMDIAATSFAAVGTLFGFLGITTGALWATYTWGSPWSWDVKQNTSAVVLLIYSAYFVLRGSIEDGDKKARISAIYNIFAFAMIIPLLYIIPRMVDSMHPGMKGNPAFSSYDLDSTMRLVFYPAVVAWILLGVWISTVLWRIRALEQRDLDG